MTAPCPARRAPGAQSRNALAFAQVFSTATGALKRFPSSVISRFDAPHREARQAGDRRSRPGSGGEHYNGRNPRLGDNYGKPPFPTFDVRDNVMYNFGATCSGMTGDRLEANYVANYIRPGPSSNRQRGIIVLTGTASVRYFLDGNLVERRPEMTADNSKMFDRLQRDGRRLAEVVKTPFSAPPVKTTSAQTALQAVLAEAGACRPVRDAVDARIVAEVRNRTGSIVDSQWEVGGWPAYRTARPPVDTGRDGMPDDWERSRGLNPNDPSDAAKDRDGDGYTNVEEHINSLAQPTAP